MTLIRFICSGVAGLSTLGLISCSAEKSRTDDFRISPPLLQTTDAGGTAKAFDLALDKVLPAEAELVFPSLENSDFADSPVEITTHSVCTVSNAATEISANPSPSQIVEQSRTFKNVSRLPLLALLPNSFLLRPETEKSNYTCTLGFSAQNRYSSIHDFTFSNVRIGSLEKTATLKLQGPDADVAMNDKLILSQDSLYQTNFILPNKSDSEPVNVILECAHHRSEKVYSDLKEFNLSDLALSAPQQSGPDLRTQYWQQRCRLVTVPSGQPNLMQISRIFEIQFTPVPLTYKIVDRTSTGNRTAFADLEISNKSSVTQIISMNLPYVNINYLIYVDINQDGTGATRLVNPNVYKRTTSLRAQTGLQKKTLGSITWYEVPAHSKVVIALVANADIFAQYYESGCEIRASTGSEIKILRSGQFGSLKEIADLPTVPSDVTDSLESFTFGVGNNP